MTELPNPFTPMAFLDPEVAHQATIQAYILVGGVCILIWDILDHLSSDYKLLFKYKVNFPTLVYILSRWSSLFFCLSTTIYQTAPIGDCAKLTKIPCTVFHVAISTTALLFFFRVRAVYGGNKYVTVVFAVLWLSVLGCSLTVITSTSGSPIGTTKYCLVVNAHAYASSSFIASFIFDTAVVLAISWRLLQNSHIIPEQNDSRFRFIFPSRYLPSFSRAFLQDGQKYYMIAFISNMLVPIMLYAKGVPAGYGPVASAITTSLSNIMACRVFRNTKFGHYSDIQAPTVSTMFQHTPSGNRLPISFATRQGPDSNVESVGDVEFEGDRAGKEVAPSEMGAKENSVV